MRRGQVSPADREHLRAWLGRFAGRGDAAFALEGCAGWRYVAEELAAAGITAHLAEPAAVGTGDDGAPELPEQLCGGALPGCRRA